MRQKRSIKRDIELPLLIMTSGTSTFSLLKLASNNCNASLGPGSAVREKGKKRGQIGKMLASEASPAVSWGGRKGRHSFPFPDYRSAFFSIFFFAHVDFFCFSPNAEPAVVPGYCYAHVIGLPHSLLSLLTSRRWERLAEIKDHGVRRLFVPGPLNQGNCKMSEEKLAISSGGNKKK